MRGSEWSPKYAGVAAAVAGIVLFVTTALSTGQPLLGLVVAVPLAAFTWLVWHRGGIGHVLRARLLGKVKPARHRPFRHEPFP